MKLVVSRRMKLVVLLVTERTLCDLYIWNWRQWPFAIMPLSVCPFPYNSPTSMNDKYHVKNINKPRKWMNKTGYKLEIVCLYICNVRWDSSCEIYFSFSKIKNLFTLSNSYIFRPPNNSVSFHSWQTDPFHLHLHYVLFI